MSAADVGCGSDFTFDALEEKKHTGQKEETTKRYKKEKGKRSGGLPVLRMPERRGGKTLPKGFSRSSRSAATGQDSIVKSGFTAGSQTCFLY
jgi:hypothetical protein